MLECPDASLLRLGAEFEDAAKTFNREYAALPAHERDDRFENLHAPLSALIEEIAAQRATTLAGLRIKALAAAGGSDNTAGIPPLAAGMADSIVADLLALPSLGEPARAAS